MGQIQKKNRTTREGDRFLSHASRVVGNLSCPHPKYAHARTPKKDPIYVTKVKVLLITRKQGDFVRLATVVRAAVKYS
jgi:hypothetical protein